MGRKHWIGKRRFSVRWGLMRVLRRALLVLLGGMLIEHEVYVRMLGK